MNESWLLVCAKHNNKKMFAHLNIMKKKLKINNIKFTFSVTRKKTLENKVTYYIFSFVRSFLGTVQGTTKLASNKHLKYSEKKGRAKLFGTIKILNYSPRNF
jgi:hypothetical protein